MGYNPLALPPDAPICSSGKRPIRTEGEAIRALAGARYFKRDKSGQRRHNGVEGSYFLCACGWYHLKSGNGHQRRKQINAKRTDRRAA